jgi:UDP-N-acetyl-2-amino-2-deoxyglucuronate dehydrogenase
MLTWVFGLVRYSTVHLNRPDCAAGHLELAGAHVRWFLSVNADHLPAQQCARDQRTYRAMTVDGAAVEFSSGFTDLHTQSYQQILEGKGFGIDDARQAVETVYHIRNTAPQGLQGDYHPLCAEIR